VLYLYYILVNEVPSESGKPLSDTAGNEAKTDEVMILCSKYFAIRFYCHCIVLALHRRIKSIPRTLLPMLCML